ncbi:hypothetical protein LEP1GSC080_2257 [Leptospira interrogans str. FPW2026]|nr:hypothetical protein LEP1GSC080_2257 [Leptospira interrogans str. FPW2026]
MKRILESKLNSSTTLFMNRVGKLSTTLSPMFLVSSPPFIFFT